MLGARRAASSSPGDGGGSRQRVLFSLVTASRECDPTFHQGQVQESVSSQPANNQSPLLIGVLEMMTEKLAI